MRLWERVRRHPAVFILSFDLTVMAGFFYLIPEMRRPFEFLMATLCVLGVLTAVCVRTGTIRNLAVLVVSLAGAFFALEMLQRKYDIVNLFGPEEPEVAVEPGKYGWSRDPATYFAARDRARADGVTPEALEEHFPGDVFAGSDKSRLWVERSRGGMSETVVEAEKKPYLDGPPLGFELNPSNTIRHSRHDRASGRMLYDGVCTTNQHGFRATRGNDDGGATYIFLGCSVTFGYGMSDDQTMPYRFSEGLRFRQRVLNLAVSNYGPHHALRELETNRHAGRAGVDPARVKAVFYGLIDDHARRAVHPSTPSTPRYELENGVLRNAGNFMDSPVRGRLSLMLARSRVYPALRDKLVVGGSEYKWELTHAILAKMDSICRDRYGVGLIVVYWDGDPGVRKRIEAAGIRCIDVNEAFDGGENWRANQVKYCLFDGHPSVYANARLGRYLAGLFSEPQDRSE